MFLTTEDIPKMIWSSWLKPQKNMDAGRYRGYIAFLKMAKNWPMKMEAPEWWGMSAFRQGRIQLRSK